MKLRFLTVPALLLLFPILGDYMPTLQEEDKEENSFILKDEFSVSKVLIKYGEDVDWFPKAMEGASSVKGHDLVHTGFAEGKGRKQSKHFVCTSCHNVVREDPDLTSYDPEARLDYTIDNGIPFLQGTTLYGAVSRRAFYNEDYKLKYGDLIKPARFDLREAIQLCAIECAQGRKLKDVELESILMYLWTIDLKIGDLNLTNAEKVEIEEKFRDGSEEGIDMIKSHYMLYSPATFLKPDKERESYAKMEGNPDNGARIFQHSCLHCHENGRYSFFNLDTSKVMMKHLKKKTDTYGDHSIYQAIRYGIYSTSGRRSYMPHYTLEKMTEQQLADLRSYIEREAAE